MKHIVKTEIVQTSVERGGMETGGRTIWERERMGGCSGCVSVGRESKLAETASCEADEIDVGVGVSLCSPKSSRINLMHRCEPSNCCISRQKCAHSTTTSSPFECQSIKAPPLQASTPPSTTAPPPPPPALRNAIRV